MTIFKPQKKNNHFTKNTIINTSPSQPHMKPSMKFARGRTLKPNANEISLNVLTSYIISPFFDKIQKIHFTHEQTKQTNKHFSISCQKSKKRHLTHERNNKQTYRQTDISIFLQRKFQRKVTSHSQTN